MLIDHSGSAVKVHSNITPAQTVLYTTGIFDEHGLTGICYSSEDRPASIHGQKNRRQPVPFHKRNCCVTICICLIVKKTPSVHTSVTETLNMKLYSSDLTFVTREA
jgi:hypothetical protein